ncbi:D-erythronate dehydrogenase [Pseudogulbenkiania ferrooxidans]|uniref:NAD-dependent epimerase/dehydratase n=1 Tax=Pseudogulbenkiania ferrooxidans 2002 TaxID=279714 RepID=B9Z843_9NEIS|nr:D-erythronate dehydrogenase [Pseudogulbenkiania ferrooxidans]EEG07098.1 NAD-dependent epimerase/dehydratase [Pseudogulbenkiania ferrooxidans 2002]
MKLLITGGAGFIGARLARTLLARGELAGRAIERLVLADLVAAPDDLRADPRVQVRVGTVLELAEQLNGERFDGVFHLASAVSSECEADFELGLRSNLDSTRALLDALRAAGNAPRLVFSSSVAVFGSDPALPLPAVVRDDTLPTPQSSYGVQKFICEQLVADYTRKGFIDGRVARLMTVSVRPGRPNGAASSFLSGIIREPLAGQEAVCPVSPDTEVALASPANTIAGLIAVFEASREAFGGRTALNLPALTVRVQDMLDALESVGGSQARSLVRFVPDDTIARIVGSWPARFESPRGERLGLKADTDFRSIVEQYLRDFPAAVRPA